MLLARWDDVGTGDTYRIALRAVPPRSDEDLCGLRTAFGGVRALVLPITCVVGIADEELGRYQVVS